MTRHTVPPKNHRLIINWDARRSSRRLPPASATTKDSSDLAEANDLADDLANDLAGDLPYDLANDLPCDLANDA